MEEDEGSTVSQFGSSSKYASADEMDEKRLKDIAYGYLCRLEEAKVWIESCIKEELPPTTELEESLRNGVYLAKLGNFFCPKVVPIKKLYDINQSNYKEKGLHFRHTDNINYWIKAMVEIGMPEIVFPETTDVYEKKNMPRVIYCLHALSLFLHNRGKAAKIKDLYGKVKFTEEEISAVSCELQNSGIQMPAFNTIGGIVANEASIDETEMHTWIIAINKAIDKNENDDLLKALYHPNALLVDVDFTIIDDYREELFSSKKSKGLKNNESNISTDQDAFNELLTKAEIQDCIFFVNCDPLRSAHVLVAGDLVDLQVDLVEDEMEFLLLLKSIMEVLILM